MGIIMENGGLNEAQKRKAQEMGISEEEMYNRLITLDPNYVWTCAIIIPVYNCEKYIEECIKSALRQTVRCEVIVVNDGSTDGTHDICKQIEGITYLIKPNGGTASALNCGIRNSHCKWIHWLSADDVLYPDAIEVMYKEISETPNNGNYIFYSDYDIIDSDGNIIGEFIEPLHRNFSTKEERFNELLGNYYGNGSSSMIPKSLFERIKFDETIPYFEDYDFWLHAMDIGMDLKLVSKKTLKYRRHKDQMTNKVDISLANNIRNRYR
jgi:teichuronic acid biosynthesis glycosyltransferase TuaG